MSPCEQVKKEIAKYSGWNVNTIYAIAQAENRSCSPTNHNETATETHKDKNGNVVCVGSYGPLQVGCIHYQEGENVDDMSTNIKVAYRAFTNREKWGNGYEAWTMYNNGEYRKYLQ